MIQQAWRTLRRTVLQVILPVAYRLKLLEKIGSLFFEFVTEQHPDVAIEVTGNMIIVSDKDLDYTPIAAVTFQPLEKAVILFVNEDDDLIGFGRSAKKFLEAQRYYVYYTKKPMLRHGKYVAIGEEAITHAVAELRATQQPVRVTKKHEIH